MEGFYKFLTLRVFLSHEFTNNITNNENNNDIY